MKDRTVSRIRNRQRAVSLDDILQKTKDKDAILQSLSSEDLRRLCVLHGITPRRYKQERLAVLREVYKV